MSEALKDYSLGRGVPKTEEHETGMPDFVGLQTNGAVSGLKELDNLFESKAIDEKYEWVDHCPVEGQFNMPEMWRKAETQTLILNLDKRADLEKYSKILNDSLVVDPLVLVLDEQKQFCQTIENWKVLISTVNVEYKKLMQ